MHVFITGGTGLIGSAVVAELLATDRPSSSAHTRRTLGWEPTHPSLLEDLENIKA